MATFSGNSVEAASGSGGPVFVFDTITALSDAKCSATKIVFGADAEIDASWSFNTGPLDDGTPRVTLATDDPAVVALELIESYLDTEIDAILAAVQAIDDLAAALPTSGTVWSYASPTAVTDTSDDVAQAAGGGGVHHYITSIQVFNSHPSVSTPVVVKSGSTVLWRGLAYNTGGRAEAITFPTALVGGDNEAINVANETNGASTYFNLQGYTV